jgi:hypothetical protein
MTLLVQHAREAIVNGFACRTTFSNYGFSAGAGPLVRL